MDAIDQAIDVWKLVYANSGGNLQSSLRHSINVYLDYVSVEEVAKKLFLSEYPNSTWKSLHKTQKDHWVKFANVAIKACKI